MAAILWAAIPRARRLLYKLLPTNEVRMNILVPGRPDPPRIGPLHFGNYTAPIVATIPVANVAELPTDASPYKNSLHHAYMSDCGYGIKWISLAAMDRVDQNHVQRVMDAKRRLSAEDDSEAYERRIKRSSTGTTFEDWTGFLSERPQHYGHSISEAESWIISEY